MSKMIPPAQIGGLQDLVYVLSNTDLYKEYTRQLQDYLDAINERLVDLGTKVEIETARRTAEQVQHEAEQHDKMVREQCAILKTVAERDAKEAREIAEAVKAERSLLSIQQAEASKGLAQVRSEREAWLIEQESVAAAMAEREQTVVRREKQVAEAEAALSAKVTQVRSLVGA